MNNLSERAIQVGSLISWNERKAFIEIFTEDYVSVKYATEILPISVPSDLFFNEMKNGNIQLVEYKKSLICHTLTEAEDIKKYNELKLIYTFLDAEESPNSHITMQKAIDIASLTLDLSSTYSTSKVHRGYKKYLENGRCIESLICKPKQNRKKKLDSKSMDYLNEVIYNEYLQLNGPAISEVYRAYVEGAQAYQYKLTKGEQSQFKVIAKSRFYEIVDDIDEIDKVRARKGVNASRQLAHVSSKKLVADHPMQRIEIDAVYLTLGLTDRLRESYIGMPVVYFAIDVFTRVIVGYVISYAKNRSEETCAVLELLEHIVSKERSSEYATNPWPLTGLPIDIVCDAGKAFNNKQVASYVKRLGANYIVTQTASPWKKPYVERFNRTFRDQLAKKIPGYLGRRVDGNSFDKTVEELAVITVDEFVELVEYYILDCYHQNPHRGLDGYTPAQVAKSSNFEDFFSFPANLPDIKVLGGIEVPRTIQEKTGIELNKLHYHSKELKALFLKLYKDGDASTRKVTVIYRDTDISTISVINPLTGKAIVVQSKQYTQPTSLREHKIIKDGLKPCSTEKETSYKTINSANTIITKLRAVTEDKELAKQKKKREANNPTGVTKSKPARKATKEEMREVIASGEGKVIREYEKEVSVDAVDDSSVQLPSLKRKTIEMG
jgi:putative transposase